MSLPVAVVLAAGVGRRLAPLTDDRPKALVELGGRPLLGRALDALAATGFERVVVVTGHRADLVERFIAARANDGAVDPVFNDAYATANNVVSFLTAAPRLTAGFCLLNSDIVFDRSILADVAAAGDGCWLAVDDGETLGAEEMKVRLDRAGRIRRISKSLVPSESAGEYIGIARFDAAGARAAIGAAERLVAAGATDRYYEDAFDGILDAVEVRPIGTRGRLWTEIDDHADHERAVDIAARLDAADDA